MLATCAANILKVLLTMLTAVAAARQAMVSTKEMPCARQNMSRVSKSHCPATHLVQLLHLLHKKVVGDAAAGLPVDELELQLLISFAHVLQVLRQLLVEAP